MPQYGQQGGGRGYSRMEMPPPPPPGAPW